MAKSDEILAKYGITQATGQEKKTASGAKKSKADSILAKYGLTQRTGIETDETKKEEWLKRLQTLQQEAAQRKAAADDIAPVYTSEEQDDIAPVGNSFSGFNGLVEQAQEKGETADEDGRKWFEKGAFADGYQFGDITKTILGTETDLKENLLSGVLGMGEKALDALAYIAPYVTKAQYNNADAPLLDVKTQELVDSMVAEQQKASAEFIAQDLYDEEAVAKVIVNPLEKKLLGIDSETDSALGEKSDALVQSAGQLAGQLGLQAAGIPWFITSGVTSFGSEAENALNQGASYEEAGGSALISAGAEILTEKLFGGDLFVKGAGADLATNYLSRAIADKTVRTLVKLGIDAAGEGFEEIVSEAISNLGSALYKEENLGEILFSEEALDGYIESFIGGAVLGGGMGTINAVQSNKNGVDYTSGLTENEQKVVDKVYNDRVAEESKDGRKVTEARKAEIYEKVLEDMDKGYISTDTIEEVLGDKSAYDSVSKEAEEFKTLYETESGKLSEKQKDRLAELKAKNQENSYEGLMKAEKDNLFKSVSDMVKNDRLSESYAERGRKGQSFQADVSQYDAKQRSTVQAAIDSGVLNNTNRAHEFVELVAKVSADKGVAFDFTNNERLKESGFALEGVTVNGFVNDSGVTVNIQSAKALNSVVGHEITHVLEGTELYDALSQAITEYAKGKGDYEARLKNLTKLYEGKEGYTGEDAQAKIEREVVADLVGDYLFTDKDFVQRLSTENRNVFQKIFDEIKYLCKVVTAGSKEARQLLEVKKAFEEAYRAETKNPTGEGGNQYSLMAFEQDGRRLVEIDQDQSRFDGHGEEEYPRIAKDIINEKFNGKVIGIDNQMFVNGSGRDEFANPSKHLTGELYEAKMRSAGELDNLLDAGTNYRNVPDGADGHYHPDAVNGFDHLDTLFKIGNRYYEAVVNIKNVKKGKLFKDVTKIKDVTQDIMDSYGDNPKFQFLRTSSMDSIRNSGEVVNNKFSLSEADQAYTDAVSRGDTETAQKMVEQAAKNAGYTIKAYHGTDAGAFTVYDKGKIGNASGVSILGDGFYFADKRSVASQYGKNVFAVYLKQSNPYSATQDDAYKLKAVDLEKNGYDGVRLPTGKGNIFMVPDPEQIKSADPVTYDNNCNVIPLSERFNTENNDLRYSISDQAQPDDIAPLPWEIRGEDVALENGAPIREDIDPAVGDAAEEIAPMMDDELGDIGPLPDSIAQQSGATDDARELVGDQDTYMSQKAMELYQETESAAKPNGKERKWVDTSTGSEAVGGKILPQELDQELTCYQPISNKKTLGNANAKLENLGYEEAVSYFNSKVKADDVKLDDIALGERLIQEAVKKGDYNTASDLIMDISILGTELGQKVQALSIIKRLTPEGQLKMLQKTVERGKAKGDKAYEGVEITEDMAKTILETSKGDGTYDQNALNAAVEQVKQQIADQMPVTFMEKVNAWRYLSMLGNPKTHIRNMVSNIAMMGTRTVKNATARTIEDIAPVQTRTKTWKAASEEVKAFAKQATIEAYKGEGNSKYSDSGSIKAKRQIFKNKVLNAAENANSTALSLEDTVFSKHAYRTSLQEYLTANGITTQADIVSNPKLVSEAKAYAMEQAKEATFQQDSYIASKISQIEQKNALFGAMIGSTIPFKKTPVNVAKTAVAYSPLGFARNIYDAVQVKKGNMDASEAIDHLAQTLTGTSLSLIGYALASLGILNGAGEDDREGKYDYQLGEQSYSVTIGDSTYSLSWLSPVAMPLFVGVNAYEQLVEGKEWNADMVFEALGKTLDPMSEMSFLSSLDDVLSSYESGAQKFLGIFEAMGQNYISQMVPTLSSQIAATFDDTKRTTRASADSDFTFGEETIRNMMYKIPGLRNLLEPSTDIWGNEAKQADNVLTRAFENFIAPYSRRENITTEIDAEIQELYRQTGDSALIPSVPYSYVNYDGKKYEMSAEEFTRYKQIYGQTAYDLMEKLFATNTYQNADDETRAEMVGLVYDYARDEAKKALLSGRDVEYFNTTEDGENCYKENPIVGAIENDMSVDEYKFYTKCPKKHALSQAVGGYDSYMGYQDALGDITSDKDEAGNTVTDSRKEKVVAYINSLDAEYGEKIILYVSEYPSKKSRDTYGYEIIDYLNSRSDISYSQMEDILTELGFTVDSEGYITWD